MTGVLTGFSHKYSQSTEHCVLIVYFTTCHCVWTSLNHSQLTFGIIRQWRHSDKYANQIIVNQLQLCCVQLLNILVLVCSGLFWLGWVWLCWVGLGWVWLGCMSHAQPHLVALWSRTVVGNSVSTCFCRTYWYCLVVQLCIRPCVCPCIGLWKLCGKSLYSAF